MTTITVIKKDVHGQETWRYTGELLEMGQHTVRLEAHFDRQDTSLHGMLLAKGDRFIETYYTDRWYNIFEIHAHQDDILRGWYCNIGCPAEWDGQVLSYIDLALDLLVFPDGRQIVLDEQEFAELDISEEVRRQARAALQELQAQFQQGEFS